MAWGAAVAVVAVAAPVVEKVEEVVVNAFPPAVALVTLPWATDASMAFFTAEGLVTLVLVRLHHALDLGHNMLGLLELLNDQLGLLVHLLHFLDRLLQVLGSFGSAATRTEPPGLDPSGT